MSMLRKYILNPSQILQPLTVELSEDLTYKEYLVPIVSRQIHQLRTKDVSMAKVLWSNHTVEDCTWETKVMMWVACPYLIHS